MPRIARVGVDSAGGVILGGGNSTVYVNGSLVAVVGDAVTPHGDSPHSSATLTTGSSTVFVGGVQVCRQGDQASCGDVISSGSPDTLAG